MKALVGAFNQEKALVGAFSVIIQPVVEPMEHYTALLITHASSPHQTPGTGAAHPDPPPPSLLRCQQPRPGGWRILPANNEKTMLFLGILIEESLEDYEHIN